MVKDAIHGSTLGLSLRTVCSTVCLTLLLLAACSQEGSVESPPATGTTPSLGAPPATVQAPATASAREPGREASVLPVVHRVRAALARDPSGLRSVTSDDGLKHIEVVGGFRHATIAARKADGTLHTECVTDADRAEQLLGEGAK
jgi:hypothetical protein